MRISNQPELHEPTLALIQKVHEVHQQGGGALDLMEMAQMFSTELEPEVVEDLQRRGDLVLTKTGDVGGTFQNTGERIQVRRGIARVTVPDVLGGTYTSNSSGFRLVFDDDQTIKGEIRILIRISVELKSVTVDQEVIEIDGSGERADTRIIHKP